MILFSSEINNTSEGIWNKTIQLKNLIDIGLNVPDFIAIPTSTVEEILQKKITIQDVCNTVREEFPQESYAVRSSWLNEDQDNSSMAGQYHTELAVLPWWLGEAIMSVIDQSKQVSWDSPLQISLIVQKYIEAEYSGVCFTRNPIEWSEMIFEYHQWIGEDLVSGKIIPEKQSFYFHENKKICWFAIQWFQDIETNLGHPQDIEWCIHDNILYYLQTRPITTISCEKYQEIVFLDWVLDRNQDYYLEKNEITEVAPRPTPFTFSLLERIYGEDGPIKRVYSHYHIQYTPMPFLKIIGNELYVDREQELQTLLPSLSTLNTNYSPKLYSISGLWQTLKNIFYTTIPKEEWILIEQLQQSLYTNQIYESFNLTLDNFMREYEIIFKINISAAKSLKKIELLIKNEWISISELLQSEPSIFSNEKWVEFDISDIDWLIWNTLEINDTTEFYNRKSNNTTSKKILEWWTLLPEWKRKWYGSYISRGIRYQQYREYARILMVRNISSIRDILSQSSKHKENSHIYFSTIDEILNNTVNQTDYEKRSLAYIKNNKWNLPSRLTNRFMPLPTTVNTGISPGNAEWYLVDINTISTIQGSKILKVQILTPDLTKYFPEIVGIISEKWWLLSHLAIIARERGIPVVVTNNTQLLLWSYINIDGSNGEIKEINWK